VVLFFSIYEGVHKLMEPIAIKKYGWGLAVLGVSMIIEGKTFMIALKQLRETSKNSIIKALKDSVDNNLIIYLKIQQHY
jgi:divalent metal cation (Fe/Co/Zn/Cd) transporter